jgi:uncharacterized protein YrrD
MISIEEIMNKNLISVKEGRQFGKITEIILDKEKFEVKGLVLGNIEKFLKFSDITSIGESSIVFQSEEKLLDINAIEKEDSIEYSKLKNLKLITEKGGDLGKIESIYVKKETGVITHYEIAETPVSEHKILSQEGIVKIGSDAVIVNEDAASISELMKSKSGMMNFIKSFFGKTKKTVKIAEEKSKDVAANVKEKIEKSKPKIDEYKNKIKKIIKKDK